MVHYVLLIYITESSKLIYPITKECVGFIRERVEKSNYQLTRRKKHGRKLCKISMRKIFEIMQHISKIPL